MECLICLLLPLIVFLIIITLSPDGREDKTGFHRE